MTLHGALLPLPPIVLPLCFCWPANDDVIWIIGDWGTAEECACRLPSTLLIGGSVVVSRGGRVGGLSGSLANHRASLRRRTRSPSGGTRSPLVAVICFKSPPDIMGRDSCWKTTPFEENQSDTSLSDLIRLLSVLGGIAHQATKPNFHNPHDRTPSNMSLKFGSM